MKAPSIGPFIAKMATVHTLTYFVAGALAYQFLTKQFYEGPHAVFAIFMRTPAEPETWKHAMTWFFPAQILRGILMGLALIPFHEQLMKWSWLKRTMALTTLYLVFGYWACATAAPGTIEGMVYLKPYISTYAHLMVQPEIVIQGICLGAWMSRWMGRLPE